MNVIFILGFKSPGKALEKMVIQQPLKTLNFLISEGVRTLNYIKGCHFLKKNIGSNNSIQGEKCKL